ncbi:complement component 1 Q subcomponent-binding protein, mitochondrial-like [Anneissia japonica]|uniref:complement component 1 Q subcomponent-binding protein, mitochondrial-like n=1 Tax=Anneissia japonica TaxID=1529436 RepID=UPI001425B03E|nr:complement component 1 Q subcomponent-binding protein, mitochondrial-like [Anneissia japonica]
MAFKLQNVSKVAYRLLTSVVKSSSLSASSKIVCTGFKDVNTTTRAFTRSLWYASNPGGGTQGMNVPPEMGGIVGVRGPSHLCACGCAGLHTEGDKELANFLEREIKLEKKHQQKDALPEVPGFHPTFDGAKVSLSKNENGEGVVISFNINHSVEAEGSGEGESDEEGPLMRSYPDFHVEVTKDGQPTLSLRCSFSTDLNDGEEDEVDQQEDKFIIDEVSIYKDPSMDSVYTVGSEVMDGDLYDLLMNMLEERGVTDSFTDTLCEFATSVEHSQYIQFLQSLKEIAKS